MASSSSQSNVLDRARTFTLPPLILHPFADPAGSNKLVESSRASLALQGLLPAGESSSDDLDRALVDGRYAELRMLFYVGKDLLRWIEQCLDVVERNSGDLPEGIRYQSIAAMLVQDAPLNVQEKLKRWGVADYKSIFARALGLNCVFAAPPPRETLTAEFIRNYFRYADQIFSSKLSDGAFTQIGSREFEFELFSSGEYSRMLERAWEQ
jgi:hypothetical protein